MRWTEAELRDHLRDKYKVNVVVPKNKYRAQRTVVNGIKFHSKKESKFYEDLQLMRYAGEVSYFHRQIKFDLPGNTAYIADFQVFYPDGSVKYYDVKGMRLPAFIKNKKMVEALYPVTIIEV